MENDNESEYNESEYVKLKKIIRIDYPTLNLRFNQPGITPESRLELTKSSNSPISLNPIIKYISHETVVLEFEDLIRLFFKLVTQLYPELKVDLFYNELGKKIYASSKGDRFTFYVKNSTNIVKYIFSNFFKATTSLGNKSRFNRLTNEQAPFLFDVNNQKFGLLWLASRWKNLRSALGIFKTPLFTSFMMLAVSIVYLSEIHALIISTFADGINREGILFDPKPISLSILLKNITIYILGPKDRDGEFSKLFYDLCLKYLKELTSQFFLKIILSEDRQEPTSSSSSDDIFTVDELYSRTSGSPPSFSKAEFHQRGLYINLKNEGITQGVNSATMLACDDDRPNTSCNIIVKITRNHEQELRALKAASLYGIGPLLFAEPFIVKNISDELGGKQEFVVHSMDKLDGTLESLIAKSYTDMTDKMILSIIDLILSLRKHNFIHHDIKPDNIMFKTDESGNYRFYIIDYGSSWYGGKDFDPTKDISPVNNVPYGYNYFVNRISLPNTLYNGWYRASLISMPLVFDLTCLFIHIAITANVKSSKNPSGYAHFPLNNNVKNIFKHVLPYIIDHIDLLGEDYDNLSLKYYPYFKKNASEATKDLFLKAHPTYDADPNSREFVYKVRDGNVGIALAQLFRKYEGVTETRKDVLERIQKANLPSYVPDFKSDLESLSKTQILDDDDVGNTDSNTVFSYYVSPPAASVKGSPLNVFLEGNNEQNSYKYVPASESKQNPADQILEYVEKHKDELNNNNDELSRFLLNSLKDVGGGRQKSPTLNLELMSSSSSSNNKKDQYKYQPSRVTLNSFGDVEESPRFTTFQKGNTFGTSTSSGAGKGNYDDDESRTFSNDDYWSSRGFNAEKYEPQTPKRAQSTSSPAFAPTSPAFSSRTPNVPSTSSPAFAPTSPAFSSMRGTRPSKAIEID